MQMDHDTVYNTHQIDRYQAARRVFDEVVRKTLGMLEGILGDAGGYEGYGVGITTYRLDFVEVPEGQRTKDRAEKTEFRFLMPLEDVRAYRNHDITGQTLLDRSIILIDDERIELRLQ
jgi:hypothetical protein